MVIILSNKETVRELLARLDERVKGIGEVNKTEHKQIMDSIVANCNEIKELRIHVNHENEKMNERMNTLEDSNLENKVTWRTIAKVGAVTSATIVFVFELSIRLIGMI